MPWPAPAYGRRRGMLADIVGPLMWVLVLLAGIEFSDTGALVAPLEKREKQWSDYEGTLRGL